MPSSNNLIQSLRSAHDPHFKLEGKVGGLEKGLGIEVAKLHKTLSKSFAMQRKTLVRVLGLEGRVGVLESQQAAEEQAKEGIDEILDDILGDSGDKPKKKKSAAKKKKRPATPVGKKIPKKKKPSLKVKKKKIKAKDIGYSSRVFGKDQSGEYVSPEERKRRFKLGDKQPEGELSKDVVEPPAQPDAQQPQLDGVKGSQKSPMLEGIKGPLKAIAESIDRIKDSLTGQSKVQEDAVEDARKSDEEKEAKKRESGLEKFLGPVKAAGEKILAPVKSLFGQIFDFFKTIFLGRIAFKLFEWFSNPANTDKVKSIFNFLADWWPVLVAGLMAIVGPGITFAVGLVALLAWGIPKIINAVKSVFGFGKDIDKEIKTGEAGLKKDMENVGGDVKDSLEKDSGMTGKETPAEVSNLQKSNQDVQNQNVPKFNKGGEVPGSGDKDTVPAMLTPGEFVMSKGAVEQYGVNTLEGMNAAAGGTNIPTMQKGGGKGMNLSVPRYSGGGKAAGVVTDPKERQQQEAYMLKYVNEERAMQGMEPLNNLTYAPGVELTKMIGPGPKITETSDTVTDLDKGIKSKFETKTMGDQSIMRGSIGQTTEEDKQKFFAANPHAAQLVTIKNQVELDNLGADISSSAKMNGGGLVQKFSDGGLVSNNSKIYSTSSNSISNFNGGGLVQGFAGGGMIGRLKNAGAKVLGKAKAQISKLQKPRVDHIHPPADPVSNAGAAQVAQSSSDAAGASTEPAPGIPNFDAGMMRSQSKIRTLGVSV